MTDTEGSDHFPQQIAGELNLTPAQVTATIALLDEPGATVEAVVERSQEEVADFVQKRREYLLYR